MPPRFVQLEPFTRQSMFRFIPVKLKLTSVLESSLKLYDFSPETPVSDTVNGNARTLVAGTGLVPVLKELIEACPFKVRGFHADNGSEYINHRVVEMLKGLHVPEFTKSRPPTQQ